jgi:PHP family Zn ribbon phosphoesterase
MVEFQVSLCTRKEVDTKMYKSIGNNIESDGYRTRTNKSINGKMTKILVSWTQRTCSRCHRFLSKEDHKFCSRCVELGVYRRNRDKEEDNLRSKIYWNANRFEVGQIV